MQEEVDRRDASPRTSGKVLKLNLNVLLEQKKDLSSLPLTSYWQILRAGDKYMKVYKQMKMYNDDELNPVLRGQKG